MSRDTAPAVVLKVDAIRLVASTIDAMNLAEHSFSMSVMRHCVVAFLSVTFPAFGTTAILPGVRIDESLVYSTFRSAL
jgi:hypothetical protein